MGTRLLRSSEDTGITPSLGPPHPNPETEIMVNQNTPVTGTVYAYLCSLPPGFFAI
jgi:hypothetical protein